MQDICNGVLQNALSHKPIKKMASKASLSITQDTGCPVWPWTHGTIENKSPTSVFILNSVATALFSKVYIKIFSICISFVFYQLSINSLWIIRNFIAWNKQCVYKEWTKKKFDGKRNKENILQTCGSEFARFIVRNTHFESQTHYRCWKRCCREKSLGMLSHETETSLATRTNFPF